MARTENTSAGQGRRFGTKVADATKRVCSLAVLAAIWVPLAPAQNQADEASVNKSGPVTKGIDYLFNYLNMSGTKKSSEFKHLTQERGPTFITRRW
jgi:hypothetical protein